MKNVPASVLIPSAIALLASTLLSAGPGAATLPQAPESASDAGMALVVRVCNECHDAERILAKRRTRAEWQTVINNMIEEGAEGSGQDFEAVFDYLALNHGRILINNAGAIEITKVLGLTRKDADAILEYRSANGPFADVDALRKVPDVDLQTLESHLAAVVF